MRPEGRHAHASRAHADVRVHDFPRFVEHFHLFLCVAIVREHVNLRDKVVCQLVSKLLDRGRFACQQLAVLLVQFVHGCRACPACRLIGCDMHPPDVRELLNGFQSHYHQDGRAVRVGNDAPRAREGVLRVHFGHHQRHVCVHAECTGVVNHDGAVLGNRSGIFPRHVSSCRDEGNVHACEVVVVLQELHGQCFPPEFILLPRAPL